jgi:hypothetical protein
LFESPSGVETSGDIGVRVEASGKAKGASEGLLVNKSIVDRASETETEDIMRWEGGRPWCPEKLRAWEGVQ